MAGNRLRVIAEVVGYFPWLRIIAPTGRALTGRHPRAAYWRDYSRRRYWTDPAYRARKLAAGARSNAWRRDKRANELPASSVAGEGEAGLARAGASPTQPPAGERTGRDGHGVPAATTPPAVLTQ